jgi:uncharacterized protein (TIGR00369 family)
MQLPSAPSAAEMIEFGRQILATQPFSVLLGAQLDALSIGSVQLHLPLSEKLCQQYGFVHGGVISYMADNALTFAAGTVFQAPVVTAEYKINYLRPAKGERLIARATAVHKGKTQAVCQCEIFSVEDGEEKLCALAQGTIARLIQQGSPA